MGLVLHGKGLYREPFPVGMLEGMVSYRGDYVFYRKLFLLGILAALGVK